MNENTSQGTTSTGDWTRFIDTLRHELKTPLTSIIAAAGLLDEELEESGEESYHKLTQSILHNASTLEARLAELFEVIRTGVGSFELQITPVDMKSLLQGAVHQNEPLIRSKTLSLVIEMPPALPIIRGDGKKLEQVVLNLLHNATKFTPAGGSITLRAQMSDSELLVSVADTGIGITPEAQGRLFIPYSRIDGDRQPHPGLGLGLAMAKQIVELHLGRIWVTSEPGRGSTFSFTLPVERA